MKLYNTLSKQLETITPVNPPTVTVYTCGPTVYDYPHIGNWFTFVRYDLLVRALQLDGLELKWVMNITDVGHLVSDADDGEDKLEKGARREGKSAWDVAQFYGDYFVTGLERLNITQPTYLTKATEHIAEQIALVQTLEAKGYTYPTSDGIYFDTSKFPQYADFAQLDIDEQQAGKRVEFNPEKRNPSDFALWKFSPKDQQRDMEWDSPFTDPEGNTRKGFPGWHLECSAMSVKYLGETIDIHAGGIDHIPVHHTNEIAQSQAATGKRFANYWMHANHVTVEGEKISKSLGNGITLEDIEAKGFDMQTVRLHIIESHYRSQSKFSWDSLQAAHNRLLNIRAFLDLRLQSSESAAKLPDDSDTLSYAYTAITQSLLDDLDTPSALRLLAEAADALGGNKPHPDDAAKLDRLATLLEAALGLQLAEAHDISEAQKALIAERDQARSDKDWKSSDQLRDKLVEQGIGLRDTSLGSVWYRLS